MKMNVLACNARGRRSISPAVIFPLLALPLLGFGNPGASQVKEGNRLYGEKKYDQAIRQYQQGLTILPDSPAIRFNIGAAEYRKNAYDRSSALFNQVLQTGDESLTGAAAYNLGDALYREGKLLDALKAFKQAIQLNPKDADAKFNYEFVGLMLKEQEQKKQQQKQDQKKEEQKQEEQSAEPKPSPSPSPQPQPQEQEQRQEMNREEAERMLDALQSEEEEQRKEQVQEKPADVPEVLKDW